MADGLITQSITNLIGGVSQQTPSLRRVDQCEEQVNCRNDPVTGMGKRYNTEFIAELTGLTDPEDYVFEYVTRDEYEQYIFAVNNGDVRVFNKLDGFEYSVIKPQWALDYLARRGNKSPQRTYQLLNTIDTTFILNKSTPVKYLKQAQSVEQPPDTLSRRYTIEIARHAYPRSDTDKGTYQDYWYEFVINGNTYRYENAKADVALVAAFVRDSINTEYPSTISNVTSGESVVVDVNQNDTIDVSGMWVYERRSKFNGSRIHLRSGSVVTLTAQELTVSPPSPDIPACLWYVKQADYSTSYSVILDGTTFSITTPEATSAQARAGLETGSMAEDMRLLIDADADWNVTRFGSVLYISRADEEDFTVSAIDDLGDTASYAIKTYVESFSDLPPKAPLGFRVEVRGGFEVDVDPYHVVYTESASDGVKTVGYWKETLKYGSDYKLNNRTLPISLNRKQDSAYIVSDNPNGIYFELEESEWAERTVGDDITAPFPSFCSTLDDDGHIVKPKHILAMTYYRNRLAFISEDNIVFSEASEFLNFFPTTVITMLDSGPIDINIPLNRVDPVEWVIETSESLFLFAPKRQLRLTGGDVFNVDSIDIDVVSSYAIDTSVSPIAEGSFIYFWMKDSVSSQLMEYSRDGDTEVWVATQVTAHVPNYVRGQVVRSVTSTNARTFITTARDVDGEAVTTAYIYNYLWSQNAKAQNAWHKWEFNGKVIDASIEQDKAYFLIKYEDGTTKLEVMVLSYDEMKDVLGHPVYLDSRQEVDSEFTLPEGDLRELHVFQGRYFVGYPYQQKYVFSEFYPRDGEGRALKGGRLQVRYLYLNYSDSTLFDVTVDRDGRVSKVIPFTGRLVGSLSNIIGEVSVETGQLQARIQSRSSNAKVTITNDSVFDAVFQTAELEGTYVNRARRA